MTTRVTSQSVFVLHTRLYRETSLLVDLLSLDYGRVCVIAHGVRKKGSKLRSQLLQFTPLVASWAGKSELMTLGKVEMGKSFSLPGDSLLSGLYMNELLMKLLRPFDPHPKIYTVYQNTLIAMQNLAELEIALRLFEKSVLEEIGYGLQLDKTANGKPIIAHAFYAYKFGCGFVETEIASEAAFRGNSLLALGGGKFMNKTQLLDIKRLMRLVFGFLLEGRGLKSRELFVKVY